MIPSRNPVPSGTVIPIVRIGWDVFISDSVEVHYHFSKGTSVKDEGDEYYTKSVATSSDSSQTGPSIMTGTVPSSMQDPVS